MYQQYYDKNIFSVNSVKYFYNDTNLKTPHIYNSMLNNNVYLMVRDMHKNCAI